MFPQRAGTIGSARKRSRTSPNGGGGGNGKFGNLGGQLIDGDGNEGKGYLSKAHSRFRKTVCLCSALSFVLGSVAAFLALRVAEQSSNDGILVVSDMSKLSASAAAALLPNGISWPGETLMRSLKSANALYKKGDEEKGVKGEVKNVSDFARAWKDSGETCDQWIGLQKSAGAYVDAYVIGSQKGATSQLSKDIHSLGVRRADMAKEWHFFNLLDETGALTHTRTVGRPLPPLSNLADLRRKHYLTGFSSSAHKLTATSKVPPIDHRNRTERTVVLDMTVEYLHSGRSAKLARALTPHARVVVTVRDPAERALSQYNMVVRNANRQRREAGKADSPATAAEFHTKVAAEIEKLRRCGYNAERATLHSPGSLPPLADSDGAPVSATTALDRTASLAPSTTTALAACMLNNSYREGFDDMLYVTRGLYFLHLAAWRSEFPASRMLVLSFRDVAAGHRSVYEDLADFLCMRPFSSPLLDGFAARGSSLSFGQQAAKLGLQKAGFDSFQGNDRYLPDMLPGTRSLLKRFYAPADARLKQMLGTHYVYWA